MPDELQPQHHQVDTLILAWMARVSYGIGSRVILATELPIHANIVEASFTDADGQQLPDHIESIHHRDETIAGIGDLVLSARVRAITPEDVSGWTLDLHGGLSFPTGKVEDNPYDLGRQKERHQHMFFGAGTVIPTFGLTTLFDFDSLVLVASVTGKTSLYESSKGYQASSSVFGSVGIETGFGLEDWRFGLFQQIRHETPASWGDELAVNSGRTDWIASVRIGWAPSPSFGLGLLVQMPYYTDTVGEQYDMPFMSSLVVRTGLDLTD